VSRIARWVPLLAVVALLGAAMLAANFADPTIDAVPLIGSGPVPSAATPDPKDLPTAGPAEPDFPTPTEAAGPPLPGWVSWVFGVACALVVLVILVLLLVMALRGRLTERAVPLTLSIEEPPTDEETERRVRAAVDAGLSELDDADADPRRAVIACWVRLEDAAAAAGTTRSVGDTSTDLVSRLLAGHLVSASVLDALAEVYREARFATHPVDAATRDQARAALRLLRDELAAGSVTGGH
jgi:hypothetical protein